jgi:hypothetical protein
MRKWILTTKKEQSISFLKNIKGVMPVMPRKHGKAKRIAYKILGVPPNISYKRSTEAKRVNKRLLFEETSRVR